MSLLDKVQQNMRYRLMSKIGEGSYGEVFLAFDNHKQSEVAIKLFKLENEMMVRNFHKEVETSTRLMIHSRVVSLIDSFSFTHERKNYAVMVMEKMDCDLIDFIMQRGKLPEKLVKKITYDLCSALHFAHSIGIYHLDVKPDNILLSIDRSTFSNSTITAKICDFGFSTSEKRISSPRNIAFGSSEYLALECLGATDFPIISEKLDIWSIGVTIFTMITGLFPFVIEKSSNTILQNSFNIINEYCERNSQCRDLLDRIFNLNPQSRPSVEEILHHPWLQEVRVGYF